MTRRALLTAGLAVLIGSTRKLFAHHSTAMYDMANPVTVKGTREAFRVDQPSCVHLHRRQGREGWFVEWEIELMSLNHLRSYGWMRTTVKPETTIGCTGGAAKSGAPSMISAVIELPDGRKIRS